VGIWPTPVLHTVPWLNMLYDTTKTSGCVSLNELGVFVYTSRLGASSITYTFPRISMPHSAPLQQYTALQSCVINGLHPHAQVDHTPVV
jgi:hypothetical protein